MKTLPVSWEEVHSAALRVACLICNDGRYGQKVRAFAVPRGGVYAALAVRDALRLTSRVIELTLVEDLEVADVIIDDIVDSGKTRDCVTSRRPIPFFTLFTRQEGEPYSVFPWERSNGEEQGPAENIRRLIEYMGDNPDREGLKETPNRVLRSYAELFSGYGKDPSEVLKCFEDGACDEMVVVRDIEFVSTCEHHMLPFVGRAHIGYVPDGRVVGVSKLVRLLEIFARRLQIQERICQEVTDILDVELQPRGSACVIEAQHLCMTARGVQKQHSELVTSSLTGVFLQEGNNARSEFFSIVRKS